NNQGTNTNSHEFELCLKAIGKKDDATRVSGWTKMGEFFTKTCADDSAKQSLPLLFEQINFQKIWLEVAPADSRVRVSMTNAIAVFVEGMGKQGAKSLFQNGAGIVWFLLLFDETKAVVLNAKQNLNKCFTTVEKRRAFIDLCRKKGGDFLRMVLNFDSGKLAEYLSCKKDDSLHLERIDFVLANAVKAFTNFAQVLDVAPPSPPGQSSQSAASVVPATSSSSLKAGAGSPSAPVPTNKRLLTARSSSDWFLTSNLLSKMDKLPRLREAVKLAVLVLATNFPEQTYAPPGEDSDFPAADEERKTLRKMLLQDDRA
ncbi:unnamed protein product, partial [Amoebophrya sp. A120]